MKETWCALSFVYTESTASLHSALVTINILLIIFVINNNQQGGEPVRRRRLLWRAHPPTRAWRGDWWWAAWGRLPPGRRRLAARWKLKWWSCVQYWIKSSCITRLQVLYDTWSKVVVVKLLHNDWWFQNSGQLYFCLLAIQGTCTSNQKPVEAATLFSELVFHPSNPHNILYVLKCIDLIFPKRLWTLNKYTSVNFEITRLQKIFVRFPCFSLVFVVTLCHKYKYKGTHCELRVDSKMPD